MCKYFLNHISRSCSVFIRILVLDYIDTFKALLAAAYKYTLNMGVINRYFFFDLKIIEEL